MAVVEQSPAEAGSVTNERLREVVREIVRGGLAGLIAGIVVAGLGVLNDVTITALLVPSATGRFTENGNRVGDITLGGSLGLIVFVGLLSAVVLGVVWVVIAPWLPGRGAVRGLVAMPAAIAFGAFALIEGSNPDFAILHHDPLVVAALLALVALTAPVLALADGWLDRRLPHLASFETGLGAAYALVVCVGAVFGGLFVVQLAAEIAGPARPLGLTVIAVGVLTLLWWRLRLAGVAAAPATLRWLARGLLVAGTVAGFVVLAPEISEALGRS